MVGISASKVGNAICESGSRRSRIHECRIFGGQAVTTPRRGTSPGTNSTPGMGLIFLRLTFGDALGFCAEAAGSSERVDGGGGLDDSSFARDQNKENIVVESWRVVQGSGEQPARLRDGEDSRIEVGEYKVSLSKAAKRVSGVWMWEGAYASCCRTTCHTRTRGLRTKRSRVHFKEIVHAYNTRPKQKQKSGSRRRRCLVEKGVAGVHQCSSEFVCSRPIPTVTEELVGATENNFLWVGLQQFLAKTIVLCKFEIYYLVQLQNQPVSIFVRVAESNAPSISRLSPSLISLYPGS